MQWPCGRAAIPVSVGNDGELLVTADASYGMCVSVELLSDSTSHSSVRTPCPRVPSACWPHCSWTHSEWRSRPRGQLIEAWSAIHMYSSVNPHNV